MQARTQARAQKSNATTTHDRIDQAIIWLTLVALFSAPLLFNYFNFVAVFNEPKVVMVHLTAGLISILWLWQIFLRRLDVRTAPDNELSWDLSTWAGRNPARWAIIVTAVWVFAQLASVLLSPLPIISFFGGDESRTGYNLYNSLSLTVILAAVAFRFRSHKNLNRHR